MRGTKERLAMRVSWASVAVNLLLSAFKLFAGLAAKSMAMVSDAVHSASDVFTTFIVMIGIRISGKASDAGHPFGHERFECVAAIVLAMILAATGVGIGYVGVIKIAAGNYAALAVPGTLALVAAVVSIAVKEAMYWYTRRAAAAVQSEALRADAWHHRSDALSSVGSLAGILGARLGLPVLDPIASLVISLFIVKAAVSVFIGAIKRMTDEACDEQTQAGLRGIAAGQPGVKGVARLATRMFGSRIYVEIEVEADAGLTLAQSAAIAEGIHAAVESEYPQVKHCLVQVRPAGDAT